MKIVSEHPYTLKSVKKGFGHEGEPVFCGKICLGKDVVAEFMDSHTGGGIDVRPAYKVVDGIPVKQNPILFKAWENYVAETEVTYAGWNPETKAFDGEPVVVTHEKEDFIVAEMVEVHENLKWAKRVTKKKVLYKTPDCTEEQWMQGLINDKVQKQTLTGWIEFIRGKYGPDVVILNELVAR